MRVQRDQQEQQQEEMQDHHLLTSSRCQGMVHPSNIRMLSSRIW
jgi:hypothetical protein